MARTVIGVMGGSSADETATNHARELGRRIAENGWVLLSGGRRTGVMQASVTGAHEAGGLTVGVLFDDDPALAAEGLDIVIPTGLGAARNIVNVLASHVVVACCGTGGTLSEIAMALRFQKPVVLLDFDPGEAFLKAAAPDARWSHAADADEAATFIRGYLGEMDRA